MHCQWFTISSCITWRYSAVTALKVCFHRTFSYCVCIYIYIYIHMPMCMMSNMSQMYHDVQHICMFWTGANQIWVWVTAEGNLFFSYEICRVFVEFGCMNLHLFYGQDQDSLQHVSFNALQKKQSRTAWIDTGVNKWINLTKSVWVIIHSLFCIEKSLF